jgi:hypothetical protein
MFNEGNQIHNFMSSSGSGTVINYGSGSDFLTSYGSGYGSGSTSQKVTVPTGPVPVLVPQHCLLTLLTWDPWGGVSSCSKMTGGKPKQTTRNNDSRRYGGPQRKQYVSTTLLDEAVHHVSLVPSIPLSYLSFVQYCALPLPGLQPCCISPPVSCPLLLCHVPPVLWNRNRNFLPCGTGPGTGTVTITR